MFTEITKSKNKGSCDLIRFSQGKWINTYGKVYTAFLFMGHAFWKENIEDSVKLLESNILNSCLKITMAYLMSVA